jgi:hypothetical protein
LLKKVQRFSIKATSNPDFFKEWLIKDNSTKI